MIKTQFVRPRTIGLHFYACVTVWACGFIQPLAKLSRFMLDVFSLGIRATLFTAYRILINYVKELSSKVQNLFELCKYFAIKFQTLFQFYLTNVLVMV